MLLFHYFFLMTQLFVFISNKRRLYIFKGPLLSSIMIKLVMYDFFILFECIQMNCVFYIFDKGVMFCVFVCDFNLFDSL